MVLGERIVRGKKGAEIRAFCLVFSLIFEGILLRHIQRRKDGVWGCSKNDCRIPRSDVRPKTHAGYSFFNAMKHAFSRRQDVAH